MRNLKTNKQHKVEYKLRLLVVRVVKLFSEAGYRKTYTKLLRDFGMRIGEVGYIDPSSFFDNYDYSMIEIGDRTTISREVLFLTHDFSIATGMNALGIADSYRFQKGIRIGENCFIGARSTILPGTDIGKNCIIGAGAVVKGRIPDNSVVIGNPASVVANTLEWAENHRERKDFFSRQEAEIARNAGNFSVEDKE